MRLCDSRIIAFVWSISPHSILSLPPPCLSPRYTCRTLFERHKLLFSFHMCAKILETAGKLNMDEYNFFLRGGVVSWAESTSQDGMVKVGDGQGQVCQGLQTQRVRPTASVSELRKSRPASGAW